MKKKKKEKDKDKKRKPFFSPTVIEAYKLNEFQKIANSLLKPTQRRTI